MNSQECKTRPHVVNINNDSFFYPYNILINKSSGSCNNINDPYAKLFVPNVIKKINVKIFNLVSRTNETRHIGWHENCTCKCRLDASVCNNKQGWNKDKCRWECKELTDKEICDKGFIWNPSKCECECGKPCDVRAYLDYKICKCRKKLVDKLVDKCSENTDENKGISVALNDYENVCGSCTVYIVLFVIAFLIIIGITSAFIYFHWYLKKSNTGVININPGTETVID